ncbi:MAG: PH domain-containing protein [Rhodothermaceae bacterium]|nr:PH domain-containing protein [Rhodothermaceae bacterium]
MSSIDSFDEVQMLHPMTLIQRFLIAVPAFIVLLFPLLRSPQSSDYVSVVAVVIYGVLALPLIFLRYYRFRYRITRKEIIIQSGIINRQHRSIPIERIQNIEIEQSVLPRLFGTAKVKIETAGSAKTEGVLEFVSVDRAHQIREIVRSYQEDQKEPQAESGGEVALDGLPTQIEASRSPSRAHEEEEPLFAMSLGRVLLTGMLRFSLFYIAIAFSLIQQFNPDPNDIELWLTKGWLAPLAELAQASPWLFTIAGIIVAVSLSWVTGILVSLNRNYNFKIWLRDQKLHKHQGLLTLSQGTIPLKRIQALIFRANVLMRKLDWVAMEVQTMGLESSQRGHQIAMPLGKRAEAADVAQRLLPPFAIPDTFVSVSKLTIRRAMIRLTMLAAGVLLPLSYFWRPAIWGLFVILFIPWYAILRYRNHGYALDDEMLYVRRGVFRHYIWAIPVSKFQVLYTTASVFQRRLGLSSVYVDTAGAGGFATPEIIDIETSDAEHLVATCYRTFQESFSSSASTS